MHASVHFSEVPHREELHTGQGFLGRLKKSWCRLQTKRKQMTAYPAFPHLCGSQCSRKQLKPNDTSTGQPLWVHMGLTPTSAMSTEALLALFLLRSLHQRRCELLPALLSLLPGQRRHQSPASTTEQHNHHGAKSKCIFFFVSQVVVFFFFKSSRDIHSC